MSSKIRQFIEATRSVSTVVEKINTDSGELNTDFLDGHPAEYFAPDADLTAHENSVENPHGVTATQVGLGNVDNTSDADKPVSSATQTALDLKANQSTTYTKTEVDTAITNATPSFDLNGNDITGTGNINITGNALVSGYIDTDSDLRMQNGDILFDANYTGIHWLYQKSIETPGNGADVSMIVDGEGLLIYEPEDLSTAPQTTIGRTGAGNKWALFKDSAGLLLYQGLCPNYDSGWISVANGSTYALNHGLGTKDLIVHTLFRPSSTATYFIDTHGTARNVTHYNDDSGDFGGFGVETTTSTNSARLYTANEYVFAGDNSYTYGHTQSNNTWTTGQVRVFLYRVGTGGE